jgi:formylglycine-generating enzyme
VKRAAARVALLVLVAPLASLSACELVAGIERFSFVDAPDAEAGNDAMEVSDAEVDVSGDGCPSGRGPAMVRVGDLCIDQTEVTEAQYQEFLRADAGPQPPFCSWNRSYRPGETTAAAPICFPAGPTFPVACVDFCDAYMFCAWAGKQLCGGSGGGASPYGAAADPEASAWMRACAGEEGRTFPYGSEYRPTACNGADQRAGALTVAGGLRGCEGGEPGLFDMSGNVWEWDYACTESDAGVGPASDLCRVRGGSLTDGEDMLRCDTLHGLARDFQQYNVGFRCCAPPR